MPTPVGPTGSLSIDALLWGWRWDATHLTVSFPQSTLNYPGYGRIEGFTPFEPFMIEQTLNFGITNLGVFTGLTFSLDNSGNGDLRFAQAQRIDYGPNHFDPGLHVPGKRGSAEANPPDPVLLTSAHSGDNWFSLGNYTEPVLGSFQYAAGLLHEVGHSLGLKHGHHTQTWSANRSVVFPTLPPEEDSQEFSVMTYRGYVGDPLNGATGREEYPWTYMLNDHLALQHMYGANFGAGSNEGDSVYSFDPDTGAMTINDTTFAESYNAKILLTIWDGGGEDTYDFSNYDNDQRIDLRPGAFSTFSQAQLSNLSLGSSEGDNFARGNVANPYLYQGDLRSLIENVKTAAGDDVVVGNRIANRLESAGGDDTLMGLEGDDTLIAGDGRDRLVGGTGDDLLVGGTTARDLRDVIFGGDGNDSANGGAGNDELNGGAGNDTIEGGAGADTVIGNQGNDVLTGSAFSDLLFGNDGFDFINGGFGSDRVNGGAGADRFFHVGIAGHGSDWIQDFSDAEGDRLVYGGSATRAQFQVNIATTTGAGAADTDEAFVIYRPTGQILWALVDGAGQASIDLQIGGAIFDLLA